MSSLKNIFKNHTQGIKLLVYILSIEIVFRTLFFLYNGFRSEYPVMDLLTSLHLGLKFDIRVAIVFSLPFIVFAVDGKKVRFNNFKFWLSLYTVAIGVLVSVYFLDFGYYDYLESRISATVINFLANPIISAQMVWQTYPVIWGLLGFSVLMFLNHKILCKIFSHKNIPQGNLKQRVFVGTLVAVPLLLGLHGNLSQYPLRWSEAFFSNNKFTSAFALNPFHYIIDTFSNRVEDYEKESYEEHYPTLAKYLDVTEPGLDFNLKRPLQVTPKLPKDTSVIVIVMESLAYYKTSLINTDLDPTPNLKNITSKSILFDNYYVQSEGTARSMFCLLSGVPDLNSNRTSSRNPLIVDQHTAANAFKEHSKLYFIGGNANWGNIRGVYKNNIENLEIFEEGKYQLPSTDVWGLSDLDLFKESYRILKNKLKEGPTFSIIQSASFHRPYTIPENHDDFKLKTADNDELKFSGFISNEEYNSLRFSDYALGHFFKMVESDPDFDNTLIVVIGDHGLPDNGSALVTKGSLEFGLERFHVPLLFYSKNLAPQTINTIAIEPDILPTVAGITGHDYTLTAFGKNLFQFTPQDKRYAFHYVYYASPLQLHVMDEKYLLKATPDKVIGLFDYTSATPSQDLRDEQPLIYKEMSSMLYGFYHGARYQLYHNGKLKK